MHCVTTITVFEVSESKEERNKSRREEVRLELHCGKQRYIWMELNGG
jgi:hypothetical protein